MIRQHPIDLFSPIESCRGILRISPPAVGDAQAQGCPGRLRIHLSRVQIILNRLIELFISFGGAAQIDVGVCFI